MLRARIVSSMSLCDRYLTTLVSAPPGAWSPSHALRVLLANGYDASGCG